MALIQDKIADSVEYLLNRNYKPRTIRMNSKTRQALHDEMATYLSFQTKENMRERYRGLMFEISEDVPDGDVIVSE